MSVDVTAQPLTEEEQVKLAIEKHEFVALPTGKLHVSFSELRDWASCSWRHKLKYVDHIDEDLPGVHMDFGTAVHATCESYLKTRVMDRRVFLTTLHELWTKNAQVLPDEYTADTFKQFAKEGLEILPDIGPWLDEQFPGWEYVDAEHFLYEPLGKQPHAFKGYIDCIITAPGPRNKTLHWLLDFKTCGWGWTAKKKGDVLIRSQVVLYKNFWSIKAGVDQADVRCGFVLLKRTAKPGNHCELVVTSAGELTVERSLKVISNMVASVKRGTAIKNREACTFCPYRGTKHCT